MASETKSSELKAHQCQHCALSSICIPMGLRDDELAKIDKLVSQSRIYERGETLVKAGDSFSSVFAVRSGAFKAYQLAPSGREQVVGFYLPSEIFGFGAVADQQYHFSMTALETSSVCEIPFSKLLVLAGEMPVLQKQLFTLVSQHVSSLQSISLQSTADERIAAFLMNLSRRYSRRGLSPSHLNLSMPRQDIANYLGLANETVSRVFSRLQKQKILNITGRNCEIVDLRALQQMTCGV